MNATRPEAETEYSRAQPPSARGFGRRNRRSSGGSGAVGLAVLAGGAIGAALLLAAEFLPLLHVHSSGSRGVIDTVLTGAHDSYALVPVALLAALLAFAVWRTGSRLALLATGLLGVLVLVIALLGDLPDAQANGLVGSATTHFALASSSPSTGLYVETLGAILLLITAAGGLLLDAPSAGAGDRAEAELGPRPDRI